MGFFAPAAVATGALETARRGASDPAAGGKRSAALHVEERFELRDPRLRGLACSGFLLAGRGLPLAGRGLPFGPGLGIPTCGGQR